MGRMIPDKVNNYNIYAGSAAVADRLIGVANETALINLQNLSETINLAGMAGEIDSPAIGQYGSVEIKIPFSNISKDTLMIAAKDNVPLIIRSAQEFVDQENSTKTTQNRTITIRGMTKAIDYGSIKKGGYGNPSVTKEVIYYKEEINGEVVTEIDKLNGKVIIGGVDMTQGILDQI